MPALDKGIDIIAYDDAGRVVLVAEVKSRVGTSEQWAARFRRNMLEHGVIPDAPFFLIATPERFYFWKQDRRDFTDQAPAFTLDAAKEFQDAFEKLDKTPQEVSGEALELLVASWLTDLARVGDAGVTSDPARRWLRESGLIGALGKSRIEMNPA